MPHTLAALTAGQISEWRATLLVRETATLSVEDRRVVDARLSGELASLGDAQTARRARALAYELDPASALRRVRGAVADRRVTIRPAPDTMALVTGRLPVAQGVAVHASLLAAAAAGKASGDQRTKDQIMADTFVERLTGQARADAVPVEIQLVMTDQSLLNGDNGPADVPGFGPVPAAYVRDLLTGRDGAVDESGGMDAADRDELFHPDSSVVGPDSGVVGPDDDTEAGGAWPRFEELKSLARVWLRRLYTSPDDGTLVTMDSHRREFDGTLRRYLIARDQTCRTPWCDAPIRHADHITPVADGGPTGADNGQGLCEHCNYTKELPGWNVRRSTAMVTSPDSPPERHQIETRTPTGHIYRSTAPPVLVQLGRHGPSPGQDIEQSQLVAALEKLIRAA